MQKYWDFVANRIGFEKQRALVRQIFDHEFILDAFEFESNLNSVAEGASPVARELHFLHRSDLIVNNFQASALNNKAISITIKI